MKVMMVVHESPLEIIGGAQVYAKSLAESLVAEGHEAAVFSMGAGMPKSDFLMETESAGVKYFTVNRSRLTTGKKRFKFFDTYQNKEVADIFETASSKFKPDVAHIHHLVLLSGEIVHSLKEKGVPVVLMLHDYWFLCHRINLLLRDLSCCNGPGRGFKCSDCGDEKYLSYPSRALLPAILLAFASRTRYLRKTVLAADVILAPSEALRQIYAQNGIPQDRIRVSTYGIKGIPFIYHYQDKPSRVFAYFGTLQPHKGLDFLVEAFNGLSEREATLQIYGSGDPAYVTNLKSKADNKRISFHEAFPNEMLPTIMNQVDAMILPSIWEENSPVSLHEARAANMPVLASRIGGIPELIEDDKTGILFEPRSAEAISEAVKKILDEPKLLQTYAENSGMVKSFDNNVKELLEIYGGLYGRNQP